MGSRFTIPRNRATLKNGGYPRTLQTIHPDFDLAAGEADAGVLDEERHKRLEKEILKDLALGRNWTRLVCTIGTGGWDTAA